MARARNRLVWVCRILIEPGCLGHQVIPLRDARRTSRGSTIVGDCALVVARHFQEMGANGVEAMLGGETRIRIERFEKLKAF